MSNITSSTLRPLTSVLGFDIIELWSVAPDTEVGYMCQHHCHSEAVQKVVRKIFPDSEPFHPTVSESWMHNSKQVCHVTDCFVS